MIARGQSGGFKRNDNLPRIRAHDRARSARAVDRHPRACRLPRVTQLRFDHCAAIEACSGTDTVALQAW